MRLSLRFVLPLALSIGLIAYTITPLVDRLIFRWFEKDLEVRASALSLAISAEPLAQLLESGQSENTHRVLDQVLKDERIFALGACDSQGKLVYHTDLFPSSISCTHTSLHDSGSYSYTIALNEGPLHVAYRPIITKSGKAQGEFIFVHDMGFVAKRIQLSKNYIFLFFVILASVVSLISVIVAKLSLKSWIAGIRGLIKGEGLTLKQTRGLTAEFRPIVKDLRGLVRELESEQRSRDEQQIDWSPRALKEVLHEQLKGDEILIVSNREPYIHVRRGDKIEVQVPASGLVTALEPIMRACSGTWVAHGSGSADREVVDSNDHVQVPPEKPSYRIRRVWLTAEEEQGYYFGFANEGLWPLCHIAHTRPTFRTSDWNYYVSVNQKFADAVIKEAKTEDPVVLVQDYHLALLPKMIKDKLPKATIITFWHIPWPNAEAFGICPWREEILDGLLGSDILGFHTRFHCNNFLATVDRFMQSRIDRDSSTVAYGDLLTAVNNYPISIELPSRWMASQESILECRRRVRARHRLPEGHLVGIGLDRMDYTKGILERFLAVERLLELEPQWIGKFSFLQIAAPTRSTIDQYQHFQEQVRAQATRINTRFSINGYQPIILKQEHHEPQQVFEYFRGSDLCFVSSLHDGMNLVAKEFIASRDDDQGVLILSQFTGAAKELPEALIVNPYNADQCAAALHMALEMPVSEQRSRMRYMRKQVQEFNVFRWAGKMLMDAARLRHRARLLGKIQVNHPHGLFQ